MAEVTLRAEGLEKSYGKHTVVRRLSLECRPGEVIGLLGPNGAGKTTTFYMIVGLIRPDGGRVYLGREDVTDLDLAGRALRGIGYLPQEPSVFRGLSVEDNIAVPLEAKGVKGADLAARI
ncbi:MAG TPA: ATP-binding cassette domain-containing protein, partial [Deltaproteobacteria bacterium]|nr:ATP-binding cassette domain-containing protein [Deltaproteobacteria bacterium]